MQESCQHKPHVYGYLIYVRRGSNARANLLVYVGYMRARVMGGDSIESILVYARVLYAVYCISESNIISEIRVGAPAKLYGSIARIYPREWPRCIH